MIVEAGAVAQPIAPKRRLNDRESPIRSMAVVIKIPAIRASNRVRITIFFPFAFNAESLKYFPTPNAMKARARSVTKSICSMKSGAISFKHHGPMITPEMI